MNALETGIYSKLAAAMGLTALLATATSFYLLEAPVGATAPYVEIGVQAGGDELREPQRFRDYVYRVKAVTEGGMQAAGLIDDQIDAALHDATLTVSGWTCIMCAREGDIPSYAEYMPEGRIFWHKGGLYRIRLYKN